MDENGRKLTCKQSVIKVINQMNSEQRNKSLNKSTSTLYETGNEQVAAVMMIKKHQEIIVVKVKCVMIAWSVWILV
jgi:hypothetical protein